MIALLTILMAAQVATGGSVAPPPIDRKPQPDKLVCVEAQQLGTRLGGHRICRTKTEWEQDRHDARADTEKAQITNYH